MDVVQHEDWTKRPIKNVLLDINGVLINNSGALEGSVEAVERLVNRGIKLCLVTNECTLEKRLLSAELNNLGFKAINPSIVVSAAPVVCRYMLENDLVPHFHIWDGVLGDFQPILDRIKGRKPNCLVVGDCMTKMSRDFMDSSFEALASMDNPRILSMGSGRYYKDGTRLRLDTGAYVAAFEYSLGLKAINFGKPSGNFFMEALDVLGARVEDTVMIGDDIVSDVGGAQKLGLRGFLVRTGKYRPSDETNQGVKADFVFDNLRHAVDEFVSRGLLA